MKQEIDCAPCAEVAMRLPRYPGEYVRVVRAPLALEGCRCDICGAPLPQGAIVNAVSMWSDRVPLLGWEGGYLDAGWEIRRDDALGFAVGDAVVYRPASGRAEDGVVTSIGERYAFVRFAGAHPDSPGKACDPRDLVPA